MFAVYCPRHARHVLLGMREIVGITAMASGVLAVELSCDDGERLVVLTGSQVMRPSTGWPREDEGSWHLVIPRQNVIVRLNGNAPDSNPLDYLPAERPYGIAAMARALRREVAGLSRASAVRVAIRVHRSGRAVAAVGRKGYLDELRVRLETYHALVSSVEPS